MIRNDHDVVAALEQAIIQRIGEPRYNIWFAQKTRFTWEDQQLVVGVQNRFHQEWLQSRFQEAIRAAAVDVIAQPVQVSFAIDPELFQAARQEQNAVDQTLSPDRDARHASATPLAEEPTSPKEPVRSLPRDPRAAQRRWRSLDEFIVGPCNRVAHASALSIVEAPGQGGNPLVIHGPVGTGKSHLLEGVFLGLRRKQPDHHVRFVTAEDFTNRFVQAMRVGKLASFRKYFRECDVLILDDLQFLATKRATQEEFLHTFDVLHRDGKQLVVSCDCHPRLTEDFMPDLADRLLGGAVWGLTPPDPETRLSVLRFLAVRGEPAVPDDVLRTLAEQLRGNVRELEGALHSLRHYGRVAGKPIDRELAQEALADLLRHAVRVVQLPEIDRAVCQALRLDAGALQTKQRAWAVSHPRMLAMYLARKHTAAAYSEIGQHFGGRNHSTVVAAEKKVRAWMQSEQELVLGARRFRIGDLIELVERELRR